MWTGQESELFAIVWLKGGIPVEKETSVLTSAAGAIAAAKLRAHDVAKRRATLGRNLTAFV
jgi:hypothetical protein